MLSYDSFIQKLNKGVIKGISFYIKGYSHYKNCKIYRQIDKTDRDKELLIIVCKLTEDNYENVSFLNKFNEQYKLFNMGKKGKLTLKQAWGDVEIFKVF